MTAQGTKTQARIAWGITGAGHFLTSCLDILLRLNQADVFLSKAAREVLSSYGLFEKLKESQHRIFLDTSAASPPVTKLYTGEYKLVVIAPVTSNSVAKMANGIADNLITNLFAHAGKCQIPTILLPCDFNPEIKSLTPQGDHVMVHVRKIDLENIKRLAGWTGVTLAADPEQLKLQLSAFLAQAESILAE